MNLLNGEFLNRTDYDELYNYLSAFQDSTPKEIAHYLFGLGQKGIASFVEGLAILIPEDKFDCTSKFNFSVDSTLNGGKFPCSELDCREKNLAQLARFAVQYSDKVLIKSPIENAFNEHNDSVDVQELAFGIYLTMRLEETVKAGYVGFSNGYVLLCEKCFAEQLRRENKTKETLSEVWDQIVDVFCQTTDCVLLSNDDGGLYVAIQGMDAYGSHEEIDIDFKRVPQVYIDIFAQRGKTTLSKDEIIQGGLVSLLLPVLSDCYSALVNPVIQDGSYLTTRSAQVELLSRLRIPNQNDSRESGVHFQINCDLPFAKNASLSSLIEFRKRNEESFLVFRDQISQKACLSLSTKRDADDFRREVIEPELHKIDLLMKNSRQRVLTAAGAEAVICAIGFGIGQYCGFDLAGTASIASCLGAGALGKNIIDFAVKDNAKDNPMYFLWNLEKNSR